MKTQMESRSWTNRALPSQRCVDVLADLVHPHIESFNFMLDDVLEMSIESMLAQEIVLGENASMKIWFEGASIASPMKSMSADDLDVRLFPSECRERGLNYAGALSVTICYTFNNGNMERMTRQLGMVPIMVGSSRCHLNGLSPSEMTRRHEDATELGGYFICNGIERIIRMLQVPRRNHIMSMLRSSFSKRGPMYSNKAVSIRCVGPDQTGATVTLHYLLDGTAMVRIGIRKAEYFIPVMLVLKALKDSSDKEIYTHVLRGAHMSGDTFISDRLDLALRQVASLQLFTAKQCRCYLGAQFRLVLQDVPDDGSDEFAGIRLLERHFFIHLPRRDWQAKFDLLVEMLRKLYSFVDGKTGADNADALQNHELLLGGHLYGMILKERLEQTLIGVKQYIMRDLRTSNGPGEDVQKAIQKDHRKYLTKAFDRQPDVGKKLFYFLSTGNLVSESGLDLMQTSGFTVVAEKLNRYRYLSHFRSVHRGQFFTEMKTTAVRKLLPESWGFMCPVHTPDGSPCGLLNHLSSSCTAMSRKIPFKPDGLTKLLACWGMIPTSSSGGWSSFVVDHLMLPIMLDGFVIGHAREESIAKAIVPKLRKAKCGALDLDPPIGHAPNVRTAKIACQSFEGAVPPSLEVCYVPTSRKRGAYPGLFLFTEPARMVRPVVNIDAGKLELIGPMEQAFMDIAVRPQEVRVGIDTHVEISPVSILSLIASLTPFSDFNQSPRNMYQCQMGKQTMGTPVHNWKHRTDTKMYRIQTPQAPIAQCAAQREFMMDEYANGTNAVVAVISYTGYDMEDAMILNKSSLERGFAHASVYKTKIIDLSDKPDHFISNYFNGQQGSKILGVDGLPEIGQRIGDGDPLASIIDRASGKIRLEKHKGSEVAVVDQVRILEGNSSEEVKKASITLRYNRNPVVGDKFSSRHGQKGVLSCTWPQEDMPFTESGMTPDVIINPHAFPSRMTIGMLIESMAGKAGAMHGVFQDSTPFTLQGDVQNQTAVDYFGQQLRDAGYNYYGSEPLYSGVQGTILRADIYIGVVYYQRLRHMVSDKSQVRAQFGPVDSITKQPVKGRKRGGGIRLGEMERDSLIAHGTAFLALDRFLNSSDRHIAYICCGSILSTHALEQKNTITCKLCNCDDRWQAIAVPFVIVYLANELAAMGVKMEIR